jgi:hypothetical protein
MHTVETTPPELHTMLIAFLMELGPSELTVLCNRGMSGIPFFDISDLDTRPVALPTGPNGSRSNSARETRLSLTGQR